MVVGSCLTAAESLLAVAGSLQAVADSSLMVVESSLAVVDMIVLVEMEYLAVDALAEDYMAVAMITPVTVLPSEHHTTLQLMAVSILREERYLYS